MNPGGPKDAQMQSRSLQLSFFSGDFLKAYIITMRPYLLFVSGITGILGMSFAPYLSVMGTILIFAASFLSYGFGQAMTDCFQIDTDSLSSPYRPLTQGVVSQKHVLIVSVIGLTLCISVFAFHNNVNLVLGTLAGVGLATYTPFKRKWWAGPFYNAWVVVVLCVMGFLSGGQNFTMIFSHPFVCAIAVVFFGYANFVLSGYFKDITADRLTGYFTLPVVFGRKVSACVSDIFAALMIAASAVVADHGAVARPAIVLIPATGFWVAGIVAAILAQVRLHRVTTDMDAQAAISPVVHSYMLVLTGIVSMQKPDWAPLLMLFYAAFVIVLKFRPAKNQI